MLSADNLCEQFGPRSGPTKRLAWSGSTDARYFLKEFFEKVNFEKKSADYRKIMKNNLAYNELSLE